jgi:hypothetical protein
MRASLALTMALALAGAAGCHDDAGGSDGGTGADGFVTTQFDLGCASSTMQAKLVPVNLVVLLDRSGSMGDGINGDPNLKWKPVTAALESFFADPMSLGMSASLAFFPASNMTDQCNPSLYYFASVPMTTLPDPTQFQSAIAAITPQGNTPTLPAIQGAIDYAKDTRDATPGSRTAIVLVTDGDPDVCNSSVNNVSLEVAKVAQSIPTYVIGVGQSLTSLSMIAQSGGTGQPTLVSVGDASQTANDFQQALEAIRGLVLTCDLQLPAPPPGMSLDYHSVNVAFTPSSGAAEELLYNSACTTGVGWRYDDPSHPSQVVLCDDTCNTVKQDHGGRVDVVFGCATAGDLIQ